MKNVSLYYAALQETWFKVLSTCDNLHVKLAVTLQGVFHTLHPTKASRFVDK